MRKTLILLTSSYPYGEGETFVANEMPHLASRFDRIVVLTNDIRSRQAHEVPPSVTCVRRSYELSGWEKVLSLRGLFSPEVWREIRQVRARYRLPLDRKNLATLLVSWQKAGMFARLLRTLGGTDPDTEVHAYSYWANDMAVAAALARRLGWVNRACCRAHGWDVYMDRTGYLPFREFLATRLDRILFVSEDGQRHFESVLGRSYPSLAVARLGTPPTSPAPVARLRPFTVVSCSALIPLKRVELMAQALQLVTSEVRWVHVGDGPTRGAVEAACRGLPGRVRVELRGGMPNADVLALYQELRPSVFLNVSRTEGLPVSMMEAMSEGVPVMATDVGGVREIVVHGSNGVLLPADPTPGKLASALDRFAALPEAEHARHARAAWETWSTRFNADRNYRSFLSLLCA